MHRAAHLYGRLLDGLALVAAGTVLALVALISVNILMRNLGLRGPIWTEEASEYGLYAVTLLSAPWLLRRGAHVRVDVLSGALPPRVAFGADLVANLLGLAISLALVRYGVASALDARAMGAMTMKTLFFPEWWLLAALPAAFLLLAVEFAFRIHGQFTGGPASGPSGTAGVM